MVRVRVMGGAGRGRAAQVANMAAAAVCSATRQAQGLLKGGRARGRVPTQYRAARGKEAGGR